MYEKLKLWWLNKNLITRRCEREIIAAGKAISDSRAASKNELMDIARDCGVAIVSMPRPRNANENVDLKIKYSAWHHKMAKNSHTVVYLVLVFIKRIACVNEHSERVRELKRHLFAWLKPAWGLLGFVSYSLVWNDIFFTLSLFPLS